MEAIIEVAKDMSRSVPVVLALKSGDVKSFSKVLKRNGVLNFQEICKESKFSEM